MLNLSLVLRIRSKMESNYKNVLTLALVIDFRNCYSIRVIFFNISSKYSPEIRT